MDDQQKLVTTVESRVENARSNEHIPLQSIVVNSSLQSDVERRPL